MSGTIVKMLLEMINPAMLKELIVGLLWEIAKLSDNTIDDKAVEILAQGLGVKLDKK